MKLINYFIGTLFLFVGLSTQAQVSQNVNFSVNDVSTEQTDGKDIIHLKGGEPLYGDDYVGAPQLPVVYVNLALPQGQKANSVTVTANQETTLSGNFDLMEVQELEALGLAKKDSKCINKPNGRRKSSTNPFPNNPLLKFTNHQYREYSYVTVEFIPFSYNEQTGKLDLMTEVTVSVNSSVSGIETVQSSRENKYAQEKARKGMRNSVINTQDFQQFYAPLTTMGGGGQLSNPDNGIFDGQFETSELPSKWGNDVPYVIITNNTTTGGDNVGNLVGKFQEFADWKTRKGTPAKVVTIDAIRTAYPGGDVPEKIRNFIKDAHQKWGTEDVLLGGTGNIVPVRWIYWSSAPHTLVTDLYYAGLEGNWNANGDATYGKSNDNADFTPDIQVGRAPVNTEDEVDNFLKKNLTYARTILAQQSIPNGDWLGKTLLSMGEAYSSGSALGVGYNIIQAHHNQTFYGMFEYDEDRFGLYPGCNKVWGKAYYPLHSNCNNGADIDSENASHSGILTQIEQGYGLINVLDHGGPYRIGLGKITQLGGLVASDFEGLSDNGKYGILFASGCYTAPIERDTYIGERWVNSPGGGVAFFGHSQSIWPGDAYPKTKNFFNLLFDGVYKAGEINNMSANIADSDENHRLAQLLGDPDLSIYTKAPTNLTVTHANYPSSITLGQHTDFNVHVSGMDTGEEALVSLYKEGEVSAHDYAKSANNGNVTFNITPDTQGDLHLTVTAHNKEPYEVSIPVTQPTNAVHLYKSNFALDDNTFGNGNGVIEPGEKISLSLELSNTGGANASGISAVLSSGDPDFTISIGQNTSDYPPIASGTSATENTTYTFTAPSSDDLRAIPLLLTISTSGQGEFKEPFLLNTKSADLQLGNRQVTKDPDFDTEVNTFASDNEVHIAVTVNNQGLATAENVTGELSTELNASVASVNSNSPVADYGDIDPQGHSDNAGDEFIVNIGNAYNSGALPFTLTLTDRFGATKTFNIDLAEAFPDFISNFNYTSSNDYIKPTWDYDVDVQGEIKGYNVYRSLTETGTYGKVNNFLITTASVYEDLDVEPLTEYWYKISVVSPTGNERSLSELTAHLTQTKLAYHGGFPIAAYHEAVHGAESSPTVYDIDGDGKKEIFLAYRNSVANDGFGGRLMGFKESGEELFDIDGSATDVYGFAQMEKQLYAKPAVGDLEGDGQAEVIAVGRGHDDGSYKGVLYGYRTTDQDGNGKPDQLWQDDQTPTVDEITLDEQIYRNPVLADLDNDGYQEILVLDEHQQVHVFSHDGVEMGTFKIKGSNYSEGQLAVADIDNDGYKEVVFGVRKNQNENGAIYIWNPDGDFTKNPGNGVFTVVPTLFHEFASNENEYADNGVVLADIDGDHKYEVLTITRQGTTGRVYAFNIEDGSYVNPNNTNNNWNGSKTIELTGAPTDIPRIAVGNIDGGDYLEVAFGSKNMLYVLDYKGKDFHGNDPNGFPKTGLNNAISSSPILADIDDDDDIEIIMNEMEPGSDYLGVGTLKAFNPDGTECTGWNLTPDTESFFVGSPFVGDIDNDGKNEVVISSGDNAVYVYDTQGDADKVEWGSYRHDAQNTGAYQIAPCVFNPNHGLDLMVKDTPDDVGNEPNTDSETLWASGDIWVRNQADGKMNHTPQQPIYDPNNANYVYVRIVNNSCTDFHNQGNGILKLHWAKANILYGWPELWNGWITSPALMGDVLSSKSIPDIPAGESTILEFEWYPPDPNDYANIPLSNQFHFCLLARILTPQDPTTYPMSSGQNNAYLNNNIASRNVTLLDYRDLLTPSPGGTIAIGNMTGRQTKIFDFTLKSFQPNGDGIWKEAEIILTLDPHTWEIWDQGGQKGKNIKVFNGKERKVIITDNNAQLRNLKYRAHDWSTMNLSFNFLTKKITGKNDFVYHIIQKDARTQKISGGESYVLKRKPRTLFYAQAEGISAPNTENDSVTLSASLLDEPAKYNWYDPDGNLIYTGEEVKVEADIAKKYKLEIIADADGYKDYKQIEVPSVVGLGKLIPNPATSQVTVHYDVKDDDSAYLMITNSVSGVFYNYILNSEESATTIDLSAYPTGVYVVSLIRNGEIIGTQNLLKN